MLISIGLYVFNIVCAAKLAIYTESTREIYQRAPRRKYGRHNTPAICISMILWNNWNYPEQLHHLIVHLHQSVHFTVHLTNNEHY